MTKSRLEAFSDGVLAIILTIMVLELKVPHGGTWASLQPLIPVFLSYVISFIYIGIYWNNHHHLFQVVKNIKGGTLWANLHLLFWLSLVPFVTGWMGENHFAPTPVMVYGIVLLGSALAYTILVKFLVKNHPPDSIIVKAIGSDMKGNVSLACYTIAVGIATWVPYAACALYVVVAGIWLLPDSRIERQLHD